MRWEAGRRQHKQRQWQRSRAGGRAALRMLRCAHHGPLAQQQPDGEDIEVIGCSTEAIESSESLIVLSEKPLSPQTQTMPAAVHQLTPTCISVKRCQPQKQLAKYVLVWTHAEMDHTRMLHTCAHAQRCAAAVAAGDIAVPSSNNSAKQRQCALTNPHAGVLWVIGGVGVGRDELGKHPPATQGQRQAL